MTATWLSWLNWIDARDALITPDKEQGQLVAANLKRRQVTAAWRSAIADGDVATGFVVDFGKVREIGALLLAFPRVNDPAEFDAPPMIGVADTIRHRLSAVTSGHGELLDTTALASGVDPGYGYHHFRLDEPVSARYWRCDISAPSRVDEGFIDVARAWAGPVFAPRVNFGFGDNAAWVASIDVARCRRGPAEYSESAEPTQAWSLTFDGIDDAEKESFDDFERLVTSSNQFVIRRNDRSDPRAVMLARQAQSGGIDSITWQRNRKQLRLVENL